MRIEFGDVMDDGKGHFMVLKKITHDDGRVEDASHVFPYDTLEWRAAEYGITDTSTLLDIVLAEPHLSEEDWAGPQLHDADTLEEARTAHISRCAKVKLRHRMSTRDKTKNDHLNRLKRESVMNPEAIELKQRMVERARNEHRAHREHLARTDPEQLRVEQLRRALEVTP